MNKTVRTSNSTSVLFDSSIVDSVDDGLFYSLAGDAHGQKADVQSNTLGRGTVFMYRYGELDLVLRHYRRGGLIRFFVKESYWYQSQDSTRMWQEFHLLQALYDMKLPAPQAVAVRCVKTSPVTYKGDLITRMIADSKTLAEVLMSGPLDDALWADLGRLLARYHRHGVYHADLNANNILLTGAGKFYLIDFDRGELRSSEGAWKQQNIDRLLRSFVKLSSKSKVFHFSPVKWQLLLTAYRG